MVVARRSWKEIRGGAKRARGLDARRAILAFMATRPTTTAPEIAAAVGLRGQKDANNHIRRLRKAGIVVVVEPPHPLGQGHGSEAALLALASPGVLEDWC